MSRATDYFPEAPLPHRILAYFSPSDSLPAWFGPVNLGGSIGFAFLATLPAAWGVLAICIVLDLWVGSYAAWRRNRFTLRMFGDGIVRKMTIVALIGAVYGVSYLLRVSDLLATILTLCLAGLDFASAVRNYKRARIKLPPGVQRLAIWVERITNGELDRRVDGITRSFSAGEEDEKWKELHRKIGGPEKKDEPNGGQ